MTAAVPPNKRSRHKAVEREEQQNAALALWMKGASYRAIGDELNISTMTAHRRVQASLDAQRPHADYDRYRAIQLGELEVARRNLRSVVADWEVDDDVDELVKAVAALLKLQEREAKLLGLDRVPTPFDEVAMMSDADIAAFVAECAADAD